MYRKFKHMHLVPAVHISALHTFSLLIIVIHYFFVNYHEINFIYIA